MTVIHNAPRDTGRFARIKKAIASGVSRAAESIGLPPIRAKQSHGFVTPKAGKRASPARRITQYERLGPFHRQVGIKYLAGEGWPLMQTYFVHRFLHATKGWRTYIGGPNMTMPRPLPAVNHARAFYGSHYGIPRG